MVSAIGVSNWKRSMTSDGLNCEETGVMSETCGRVGATWANISMGLDLFSLWTSEVAELLAQDEDLVPFLQNRSYIAGNINRVGSEKGITKNSCPTKGKNIFNGSTSLYFNGAGSLLPEFKKERLKILLQQSVFTLSREVDELINPVLSLCRLRSCLRYKDSLRSSSIGLPQNIDESVHAHKKLKALPSSLVDDDMRLILEYDSTKVEELMNTHSDEIFSMLQHMEQKLEELLNAAMTTCRPMTPNEKQQLCKRIKELPPRNVDRVVEILGHSKTSRKDLCNELYFDLDSEDQITLWRLYFYVSAIEKAKTS
ncbi:uncharacterized protein [Primulina huaijiensis]|uniref:uncharacterized protein isoform X1 n=2 Tax=Primulina huaijiensis TaxID=1492673 RepID=UPI003CC76624